MKSKVTILLLVLILLLPSLRTYSQQAVVDFLKGGVNDAEKLAEGYLQPLGFGLGSALNGGWFNTGKVHKTLGFNVTLTASAALIPSAYKQFDLSEIGFEKLQLRDPNIHMTPTIASQEDQRPILHYSEIIPPSANPVTILEFASPNGLRLPAVPMPMVRAGIGLPLGFEIIARYMPTYDFRGRSFSLWGAGLKYDLLQIIPIANKLPFLNLSVMGAYSQLGFGMELDFQRNAYPQSVNGFPVTGGRPYYEDQELELKVSGYTFNLIASADFPFITAYAALGYTASNTTLRLLGDYPLMGFENQQFSIQDVTDPISIDLTNPGGPQLTVGAKLKLAVIHFHADYTLAEFPVASAGIGVSIR